jgi:hypothetical protein
MKIKLLLAIFVVSLYSSLQAQVWDEGNDGDLSDDGTNPSGPFELSLNGNTFIANQTGNPRDVDFFAFTIPAEMELTELIVDDYNGVDDVAFIGIDSGATTDVDFMNPSSGDLLGGTSYGTASIGNDILAAMGNLGGADGFIPPLGSGTYTIWLNQTGGLSESTLNFIVDETLSLEDNSLDQNNISIFPNPAKNYIAVSGTEIIEKITLFDILGKRIKSVRNKTTLDISNLTSGIYLANIETPSGTTTKKIIKQ